MESTIRDASLKERPVAPGPPANSVSPEKTAPSSGTDTQIAPGEWPGVCSAVSVTPATVHVVPSAISSSGARSPYTSSQSIRSSGCSHIGGASVKLFLPIFKMNFPEIVDIALPAEGVFHNLVFVSIKKTYPMQAYKIMHGLWGMGQMMFTKYIVVVDAGVNVHNTSEVLFHLTANTDPQRDSLFTKGPSDVLDHATSEIASGSKLGIDATKKIPGEGFKRAWPPLIKMDEAVKAKVEKLLKK